MIAEQAQIAQRLQQQVGGRRMNVSLVVDQLLAFACEVGEFRCNMPGEGRLRIEISHQHSFVEIQTDAARGRLRSICARLAKLCQESGQDFCPYGGEGVVSRPVLANGELVSGQATQWAVRFMNTPDEHWFSIAAK